MSVHSDHTKDDNDDEAEDEYNIGEYEDGEDEEEHTDKPEPVTFFSEVSMQELAFGIGTRGVNSLCVGMMLNIPTLKLHELMYANAPNGLLDKDVGDVERVTVSKAIIDYWCQLTKDWKPKKRFKQLYEVFKIYLKEKEIAEELQTKFEANRPISLDAFYKFDMGRLGPYVPPTKVEVMKGGGEEEVYEFEDE